MWSKMTLTDNRIAFRGADHGFNVQDDVLYTTADGTNLNDLWSEFQATLDIQNAERQTLIDFLTYPVTNSVEEVVQGGTVDFEEASEFGVPKSGRPTLESFSMGFDFKWYDLAKRYTWMFLAEADSRQTAANHQVALEADNRLMYNKVMWTLFNNVERTANIKGQAYSVYPLYNADGTIPPSYGGNTFTGSENHYLVSGNALVDSTDVEDLIDKLEDKGYSAANGTQLVILVNKQEGKEIRKFRANVANNNAAVATYDFIPSTAEATTLLTPGTLLLGQQPPSQIGGLTVIGSYGSALIVQESRVPAGYMAIIGTGGSGGLQNPIGLREHARPEYRGLRLIEGDKAGYPLVNSYYSRGFGTGIRQRGGAAIMQVKAAGLYEVPAQFV